MPTPKKPKRVTKSDVENGKEMIVAKARGELKSAVYDAYRGDGFSAVQETVLGRCARG